MYRTLFYSLFLSLFERTPAPRKGPNVLLIMADDQDKLLNSLDPAVMPNVHEQIIKQGVNYDNHYCTVAWCCPSRVNFLTGRAAHNTNVTGLDPPYGGWPKFASQGLNDNYLPVWLQAEGIKTYYAGKLFNSFTQTNYDNPTWPKGWDDSSFLVDPWTYKYTESHWVSQSDKKVKDHTGTHTTLVLQQKALDMLETAATSKDQFFMMVAPVAPHAELKGGEHPPPPPPMFKGKFSGEKVPRVPNFNPDKPSGASWVKDRPLLTDKEVDFGDNMHVHRLENIAGIDHMVGLFIDKLKKHNILDNTYIIYTSDNGFHISHHRLKPGKRCGFEEDINIPLLIRGPNVPQGIRSDSTSSHTDMAPTILEMMNVPLREDFDGQAMGYNESTVSTWNKYEQVNVEYWDNIEYGPGGEIPHEILEKSDGYYVNGTYKGLRMRTKSGHSFFYNVWCTGEKEFYDMNDDFYQMTNYLAPDAEHNSRQYFGRDQEALINRLDAMLMVLKNCKQDSCRNAWDVLFPHDKINGLQDAMEPKYDDFFANQPKVSFAHCIGGAIRDLEGPQNPNIFR